MQRSRSSEVAPASASRDPIVRLARERLSTAVLSDTLDGMGLIHQIMERSIRPLDERLVLCGRARTGNFRDVYHFQQDDDVYEPLAELVADLHPDDVAVLACGRSGRIAPWGSLLSLAAQLRGAGGCITDGLMRDVGQIRELGFPAFSAGYGAIETRGRAGLIAAEVPVHCGGVWVSPGDLLYGDVDGVVVVPRDVEADVVRVACEKAAVEREIVDALRSGTPIVDVFRRFGSL